MPAEWPRNIIPYTEETLRALSSVAAIEMHETALDHPIEESALGGPERAIAEDLVKAGLFRREGGRFVRTARHWRDADIDMPGRVEHKRAVANFAESVVRHASDSLHARGADATLMTGVVALRDSPEAIARATTIIAEAEDQLRALAEEHPPQKGERTIRAMVFIGSR